MTPAIKKKLLQVGKTFSDQGGSIQV